MTPVQESMKIQAETIIKNMKKRNINGYYCETKEEALEKLAELERESKKETQVAVLPFKNFYEAEEYHQDYYLKNPEAFEEELIESGRKKL